METIPKIVGVLNLSPDSFSDGRIYTQEELATRIQTLLDDGVDIIEVGAESTAPGSHAVCECDELRRLEPFFKLVTQSKTPIPFGIDTMKAAVARAAITAGAIMINDVSGGRHDPMMFELLAEFSEVKYVCMYSYSSHGRPDDNPPVETDILACIQDFFAERIASMTKARIQPSQIIVDPGMGAFLGKNYQDSITVLRNISFLRERFGLPIYVGTSRKGFLKHLVSTTNQWPQDRLGASLATALYAATQGAEYLRVHDVRTTKQILDTWGYLIHSR